MKTSLICLTMFCALASTPPLLGLNVLVASESAIKCAAVKEAFCEAFPTEEIIVTPCAVSSGVPEQPVGHDEGLKGAATRLSNIPQEDAAPADYVVAIENYIYQDHEWKDCAVVLVQCLSMDEVHFSTTASTEIPSHIVTKALAAQTTVGETVSRLYAERAIDKNDWHRDPQFGGHSRKELIKDAIFKNLHRDEIREIKEQIVMYPDYPKEGILFQDFMPVMRNPSTFKSAIHLLAERAKNKEIDVVVGLESRGFIVGGALAYELGVAFVPIRKAGKTPGKVIEVTYEKEYGTDSFALAEGAILQGQRVLIVDDLIATGGSARAAVDLIMRAGGIPVEFNSLLEIPALEGAKSLGIPTFNLID
ncbi:MAG: adenine phosphoribosyltransferase [Chlamydiales bacterium]|nr:adenine phosphoribosyltransferase [Chlamydiia bacterium]MCP5506795.1 adenine phosphoribosyltransferase [Chlamydiales bacterium]